MRLRKNKLPLVLDLLHNAQPRPGHLDPTDRRQLENRRADHRQERPKGEGSCSTKYLCDLTERGIKDKRLCRSRGARVAAVSHERLGDEGIAQEPSSSASHEIKLPLPRSSSHADVRLPGSSCGEDTRQTSTRDPHGVARFRFAGIVMTPELNALRVNIERSRGEAADPLSQDEMGMV